MPNLIGNISWLPTDPATRGPGRGETSVDQAKFQRMHCGSQDVMCGKPFDTTDAWKNRSKRRRAVSENAIVLDMLVLAQD